MPELPFSAIDEGIMHLELATNPWNIQVEIGASGRLEVERLDRAIRTASAAHPMARAAMKPWSGSETHYTWSVTDTADLEALPVVDGDARLDEIRSEFFSRRLGLEVAPAFRAQVVRRAEGDLFLLSVSHVVADGVGVLRLLHSITRAYRGVDDPADPTDLATARDLTSTLEPEGPKDRLRRGVDNLRMLRDAIGGPARIAATSTTEREAFGFVGRTLGRETTDALFAAKPEGATLNDVLMAALHLTIDRWNADHGETTGRIVVMMPFNIRPTDRFWEVMSNIVTFVNVGTDEKHRTDLPTAIAAVAEQSTELKKARGAGLHDLANLGRNLPVAVKRLVPGLLPLTGGRFIGTAVLSNLGRLPETPTFEDDGGPPPEIWFSPPCAMPLGVGVGVGTIDGSLYLMVRYRFEQFDEADGAAFADLLVDQLTAGITEQAPERPTEKI